jgi:hypothetical protein
MGASFHIRRLALLTVGAVVVIASISAILHLRARHSIAAAQVVVKQTTAVTANQPSQPQSEPQAQKLTNTPDEPTVFASIVAGEVSQLQEGITLAKWMEARGKPEAWGKTPDKKLETTDPEECLSYMKVDTLPSGTTIVRVLHFYPPPVPSPAIFPTLSGQGLIDTCLAATVDVQAEATTPEGDHALDQAARQQLSKQYGESLGIKDVRFWERNLDRGADRWIDPKSKEIIAGYDSQGLDVFVHVRLPLTQEVHLNAIDPQRDLSTEPVRFHQAVAAAGLDPGLSERMENLYALDTSLADSLEKQVAELCKTRCPPEEIPTPKGDDWRTPLLPLLQDWFKALQTAQAAQRAAGLFAADRLLVAFAGIRPRRHFGGEKSGTGAEDKLRTGLEELGAVFAMSSDDDSYYYTGNWMQEGRKVSPDSEAGRLALLEWMNSGDCDQPGSEAFRKIISEGEALLTKKVDAPTAAQGHFMVGDAYSDIVALAGGETGGNGDYTGDYQQETNSAHAKALTHYRAGLAIDNTSRTPDTLGVRPGTLPRACCPASGMFASVTKPPGRAVAGCNGKLL